MPELFTAVAILSGCFKKYAGTDGDPNTLSKAELKKLLQTEFEGLLSKGNDNKEVDRFFEALDQDKNGKVDFVEFSTLVITLGMALNDCPK
ncbi:unnamed protein product [Tetraodon nigroviridis]|uniref:Protein S100 n=1 Tax=Tetraodon nigroviridis TaxID=99883 RepID=Q4RLA4_TETNG|nr:unnamed protein product [Tetraodon nigroviridis]